MDAVKCRLNQLIQTPTLISIGIGIALLLWQQATGGLTPIVQSVFFFGFIALTGIPHGAIDHLVEKETAQRQNRNFDLKLFLLKYILTILLYGLMWYIFPSISLIFFLIISAEHFGETDIEKVPESTSWHITRFVFGVFIIFWLLLFHSSETTEILQRISKNNTNVMLLWHGAVKFSTVLLSLSASLFVLFFYFSNKNKVAIFDKSRFLRLFVLLILTCLLPLLPAFAIYFGGWHAICSLKNIHDYLINDIIHNELKFSQHSIIKIWKKTIVFSVLAILFFIAAAWYRLQFFSTWDPLPSLFIFLSLITLPHLEVMRKMNR